MLKADSLKLPETIDDWTRTGPPQKITRETIFDYMDGGGELYLAYKFNQLLVWKYQATKDSENEIVVEVYEMQHPDEAFGLLSLDWTGEPLVLNEKLATLAENPASPTYTALYGQGLLRARVDNLYLRILAPRETAEVKEIILKLGKIIADQSSRPSFPDILKVIRPRAGSRWQIKKERTSYFHSHLILNSLYYLSHENILHLGPECEAFYSEWVMTGTEPRTSARLFAIKYPESQKCRETLTDFVRVYLYEKVKLEPASGVVEPEKTVLIEDGLLSWKLSGNLLALIFEAPDKEAIKEIYNQIIWK